MIALYARSSRVRDLMQEVIGAFGRLSGCAIGAYLATSV
jgi:hypothetical protein